MYKYYFKKPRGEIVKDILSLLLIGGVVAVAATSPFFGIGLLRALGKKRPSYHRRSVTNAFYRLKKRGLLDIQQRNHQIYISLTKEGKRQAGVFQINDLKVKKPKRWDGKWRVVIFDIAELSRIKRDGFRGFLKNLGFRPLQQSVWAQPYECRDEIKLLTGFFGLNTKEVQLLTVEKIGDDRHLRAEFNL